MDGKSHMAKPQAASWPRSHRRSSGSGSGLDGDPCRHIQGGATPPGPPESVGHRGLDARIGGAKARHDGRVDGPVQVVAGGCYYRR